ncbi:MAG: TolC family protein [Desulforegulaceae bacterium]|nr:TolC family protein [Desulforegulaceae bacterium]
MKKYFLFSIVFILFGVSSAFSMDPCNLPKYGSMVKKLSLKEAIETALKNNPDVQKALYDTKSYIAEYDNAVSGFMPEISAYVEYLHGDSPSSYLFKAIDQRKLPLDANFNDPGSFDNFETGISAKMRLFNGNRTFNSKKMAKEGVVAGELMENEIKNSLIYLVISVWYDILNANDMVKIANESATAIEEQVRIAGIKFKGGSVLESDLLSLRARFLAAKENLMEAENRCRIIRARLAMILGLDPSAEIDALKDDFEIKNLPLSYENLVQKAIINSPYLKAVKKQTEIANYQYKIEKGGYLPTLDLQADYYHDDPDFKFSKERQNYRVGVVMGVKLFSGFSTSSKIKKADALMKKALENERKVLLDIKMQARKAWFDFELAKERQKVAKLQKKDAQASFELVKRQYEGGSVSITRYLEAELARNSASTAERKAFYRIKKIEAKLAETGGNLFSLFEL